MNRLKSILRFLPAVGIAGMIIVAIIVAKAYIVQQSTPQESDPSAGWVKIAVLLVTVFLLFVGSVFAWSFFKAWRNNKVLHEGETQLQRSGMQSNTPASTEKPKAKSGWTTFWKWIAALFFVVILFEFGLPAARRRGWLGANQLPSSISPVRTDLDCRDDQGHRKEVHQYEAFAKANFVQSFQVGCSTLMVMPRIYGYHWHMQPVADDPNQRRWFYAKEVGGPWRGPFLLGSDANMRFDRSPVPVTFYIQPAAGQSGDFKVDFGTDLILPAMPEPEAKTAPMEQVEPSVEPERIYNPDEDGVVGPQPITRVEPNYTDEARRKKIMGVVIVNCVIDKDGSTRDFEIVQSLGFGLDEQAIHAVSRWRFAPATKDGVPVPIHGQISVRFKLI